MFDMNYNVIRLYTRPSISDPAHLVRFSIDGVGLEGTRLIKLTINFLCWLIKRHLDKHGQNVLNQLKTLEQMYRRKV